MNTLEQYIDAVLSFIPAGRQREHIEMDLRANLTDRFERVASIDEAIAQFGDPRTLAESYLAAVPLFSAPFLSRAAAALIDIPGVFATGLMIFYVAWQLVGSRQVSLFGALTTGDPVAMWLCIAALVVMTPGYYILSEYFTGQTIGKALLGLRVVRESGAKISFGQAFIRQIPLIGSFLFIDALFALFTEKKQRAFELISKTRVVRAESF